MTGGIDSTKARGFRPDIEGLRAIAVALVVLDHAGVSLLAGGYVGVDVFFVLSGFLITGLLLKEHEQRSRLSLVGFYARRVRRILPAGTLVLVVTVVAAIIVFGGNRATRTADDAQSAALFVSNFHFIAQGTNYWALDLPASPLQHYWSLSIEEQFYLVWPTCLILIGLIARTVSLRKKLAAFLLVVIVASLTWSVYQTAQDGTEAYFSTLPRIWELATGALLAVTTPWLLTVPRPVGRVMSVVGVVAIAAAAVLFDAYTPFPGFAVALPVGGAALAVAGGTSAPGDGAEWILRLAPFQWVGKLSYSLYLWHWPLFILFAAYSGHDLTLAEGLLLSLGALVLSWLTFLMIEHPVRSSTWLKSRPALLSVGLGACFILFSLSVVAVAHATQPALPTAGSGPATVLSYSTRVGDNVR